MCVLGYALLPNCCAENGLHPCIIFQVGKPNSPQSSICGCSMVIASNIETIQSYQNDISKRHIEMIETYRYDISKRYPTMWANRFLCAQKYNLLFPRIGKSKKSLHPIKTLFNPNPFQGDLPFSFPPGSAIHCAKSIRMARM